MRVASCRHYPDSIAKPRSRKLLISDASVLVLHILAPLWETSYRIKQQKAQRIHCQSACTVKGGLPLPSALSCAIETIIMCQSMLIAGAAASNTPSYSVDLAFKFQWASALHPAVQVIFQQSVQGQPVLQRTQRRHLAAGAAGAACFVLEDLYPKFPFIHAAWHCLSAYGIATTEHLVAHKETSR